MSENEVREEKDGSGGEEALMASGPLDGRTREQDGPQGIDFDQLKAEQDPLNWPAAKRWRILGVVSMMTFLTSVHSSFQKE